ncbi:MAG: Zn-ribbon domain-containing OB-fold protein [Actinomycetota bacterium]|nr:Zn-ribbon domain-containing OB-fold protein [Actinomycetota bacterium]
MSYHTSGHATAETKALPPVPLPDDDSAPFWKAAARHELVLQRCAACGAYRHPPRPMCPSCLSMESVWVPASGHGRVWSWVVVHPPVLPAFAEKTPYNVAVIELDEGVRMVGNVLGIDQPDEGMEVEVVFEDVEEGVSLPQWRPV